MSLPRNWRSCVSADAVESARLSTRRSFTWSAGSIEAELARLAVADASVQVLYQLARQETGKLRRLLPLA